MFVLQVALKTLIVIHRALREVDPTFREELINYGRSRNHMLNLSHFKDDSSAYGIYLFFVNCNELNKQPFYKYLLIWLVSAWDYSAWVRTYALFLEERLECFRVLKYDVESDPPVCTVSDLVLLLWDLTYVFKVKLVSILAYSLN